MTPKSLSELADQLRELLPRLTGQAQDEVRASLKVFLESALGKLNLVTREEFETQTALLQRTREKLDRLERLVSELEQRR